MSAPIISLSGFQGTLEELVLKVRRGDLSLPQLPLSALTEQLIKALQGVSYARLEEPMEWMELTCRLIHWKSSALLPAEDQAAATAALHAEIDRQFAAIERSHVERLRDFLTKRLLAAGGALEAPSGLFSFQPDYPEEPELFPSLWSLRQKFQFLRRRINQRQQAAKLLELTQDDISVTGMSEWLKTRLGKMDPGQPIAADLLLAEVGTRARQAALFLAMLELARSAEPDHGPSLLLRGAPDAFQVSLAQ